MKMRYFVYCSASLLAFSIAFVGSDSIVSNNVTASDPGLLTWWHNNGEVNYQSPVQQQNVRQSHIYSAWVNSDISSTAE